MVAAVRAVQLKCPNCGATLQTAETALQMTCTYCGQVSRIQQRSRVLQRLQPPVGPSNLPVVTRPASSTRWVIFAVAVVFAGATAGSALFIGRQAVRRAKLADTSVAASERGWSASWDGRPVIADVDGDGVEDLIGMTRYQQGDQAKLAAFSGVTGKLLWESPGLGKHTDATGLVAAAGDKVLRATSDGRVHAHERATGARAWALDLGEKTAAFCSGDAGAVIVATADQRAHRLELATGVRSDAPALRIEDEWSEPRRDARDHRAVCDRISDNNNRWTAGAVRTRRYGAAEIPGFSPSIVLRTPAQGAIAVGSRTPGTSVPMLAALDSKLRTARWTAVIPSSDVLNARSPEDRIALTDDLIAVTYHGSDNKVRLTTFALADGVRRWDVPVALDWNLSGVAVTRRAVVVAAWSRLQAFDLKTGNVLFEIR